MRDEPLVLDHVEHCERRPGRDRVPAERAEELARERQPLHEFASRDHGSDGIPVSHRLPERHHVGRDAILNERPEVFAQPAVAGLHLVRDEETAGVVRPSHDRRDLLGRRCPDAVARQPAVEERHGDAVELCERALQLACDVRSRSRRRDPDNVRRPLLRRPLFRRQVSDGVGDAVICVLGHDRPAPPRHRRCDPPRDVVRLAARVDEHHRVEPGLGRHRGDQPFSELDQRFVQIAGVRVERPRLADNRLGDARMAVTDDGHVVVGVEQAGAVGLVQPHAFATNCVNRPRIRERCEHRAERVGPASREVVGRRRDTRRTQLLRDGVRAHPVEQLEQRPRVVVPGLDVLRVLRVAAHAPGADRDDHREPSGHEVSEHRELLELEGEPRRITVDGDAPDAENVAAGAAADQRRERDGKVRGLRRIATVTEVDDPVDAVAVIEQHVLETEIAVHHLRAQLGPPGADALLERVDHASDKETAIRVVDSVEQRPELRRVLEVPEQLAARRRMEERTEGEVQPRVRGRIGIDRAVLELRPADVSV